MEKIKNLIILAVLAVMPCVIASGQDVQLPEMPHTQCAPSERATCCIEHFWDNMCFADTTLSHNCAFMEQNLKAFFAEMERAPVEAADSAFAQLLRRVSVDERALSVVYDVVEQCLNEWDSPLRNEDLFISFLKAALAEPATAVNYGDRTRYLLEVAMKNRPGSVAADFTFEQADDTKHSLHEWVKSPTLLVLYSADCDHCHEVLTQLQQHEALAYAVERGTMSVLAVCIDDNRDLWRSQLGVMPRQWTVGYDGGRIMDAESYELSALPAIYVLEADCRIRIKELRNLEELNSLLGQ
ncbi:MAG: DUF5106 domain-containing protein [Muribaculaceae bacterium]